MHAAKMLTLISFLATNLYSAIAQTTAPAMSADQIVDRISPAMVLILAGSGDGHVAAVGSGLIVRADGVVLTANHVVKGMQEVQVRLRNGDVYDRVELIASDDRRDVAALRIPGTSLPVLPVANSADVHAGSPVYVVAHGAGVPWTASAGVLGATRMADEVSGAGSGYRLLQFTAPLASGSSGGVLVDTQARALGIMVSFIQPGQNANFAVPLDSIAGLASISGGAAFASGARLQLPASATAGTTAQPGTALRNLPPDPPPELPPASQLQVHTLSVLSKTIYIRRERLQDDLRKQPLFGRMALRFADYGESADVGITVDRPVLTFDWTYTLVYQPTGMTLASGTIIADDEFDAGPNLAGQIMEQLAAAAVLPRSTLAMPPASRAAEIERSKPTDSVNALRTCKTMFVESHTIYMKGNLLQDALYTRPEVRDWGIRIVDDRQGADMYIDVTRPFLTYDWVYRMIDNRSGTVLGTGQVTAWDGRIAAPQLAAEIVKVIRASRPLPSAAEQR
jgi:hypothetical protein